MPPYMAIFLKTRNDSNRIFTEFNYGLYTNEVRIDASHLKLQEVEHDDQTNEAEVEYGRKKLVSELVSVIDEMKYFDRGDFLSKRAAEVAALVENRVFSN
jgi:hypothetical protein